MSKAKTIIFALVLYCALSPVAHAEPGCRPYKFGRGVESGGGGTILLENDIATLLDFLHIDRYFRDSRPEVASYIETSGALLYNRFEGILSVPNIAFENAFNILGRWREVDKSVTFAPSLEFGVVSPTTWFFVEDPICVPADKVAPQDTDSHLRLAAYYVRDRYQVNISRPLWNKMGLKSQVGLIIHESIRHLQIGLKRDFDEEVLQQATALLVWCEPTPLLSRYIQFILNNKKEQAEKTFGTYSEILQECKTAKLKF